MLTWQYLILPLCEVRGLLEGGAFMPSDFLSDVPLPGFSPCLALLGSFRKIPNLYATNISFTIILVLSLCLRLTEFCGTPTLTRIVPMESPSFAWEVWGREATFNKLSRVAAHLHFLFA